MEALILDSSRKTADVKTILIPTPTDDEVLIKVHAIGLNPVDALYTSNPLGATGRVVGSDFAGIVVSPPSNTALQAGQRVAGFLQGACSANDRPGAFAEFLICPADLLWQVPEETSLEEAAGVSLCALTAAQALFLRLGLAPPFLSQYIVQNALSVNEEATYFFIYGASTSVALYAAQLLRLSPTGNSRKITLIGAASKARWAMLQAAPYSYDYLVDYRDADWPEKVLKLTGGAGVTWAFDCISEGSTVADVSSTLRTDGQARIAIVRSRPGGAWDPSDLPQGVDPLYGAVWEGLGEEVQYQGFTIAASRDARDFSVAFYTWLSSGGKRIEAVPVRLMPGGLHRVVPDGFALLGSDTLTSRKPATAESWMQPISAEKLVYRIIE